MKLGDDDINMYKGYMIQSSGKACEKSRSVMKKTPIPNISIDKLVVLGGTTHGAAVGNHLH